jgi:hypothetical protein
VIITLIAGIAGILAGGLIILAIRWSARFAVAVWQEITPEPHVSELIANAVVRRLRKEGMS